MWRVVKRVLGFTDKSIDRAGYWHPIIVWIITFFGGGTAVMTWLGSYWQALYGQGWAAVVLFGIAAALVTILVLSLAAVAWRFVRTVPQAAPVSSPLPTREELEASRYSPNPASEAPSVQAYYELVDFTISKLLPACNALSVLLATVAEQLPADSATKKLLVQFGFQSYPPQFWGNLSELERDLNRSEPELKFYKLMHCIGEMESGSYYSVILQADVLKEAANTSFADSPEIFGAWQEWAAAHNAMLDAYEKIRTDPRFTRVSGSGKRSLFRPLKEVRWGPRVDPMSLL